MIAALYGTITLSLWGWGLWMLGFFLMGLGGGVWVRRPGRGPAPCPHPCLALNPDLGPGSLRCIHCSRSFGYSPPDPPPAPPFNGRVTTQAGPVIQDLLDACRVDKLP